MTHNNASGATDPRTQHSTQAMTAHRRSLGERGEQLAADYLCSLDWQLIERNWRCPDGEIDILAHDPAAGCFVVVEVKTRATAHFGRPVEAVGRAKIGRLHHLGRRWLRERQVRASYVRVDVVGIVLVGDDVQDIEHLRDVS